MGGGTSLTITASVTGNGTITPSGTVSIPQGYNQTYYIEGGSPSDGGSCPTGYTFITARNLCEKSQAECPTGYSYDIQANNCTKTIITYVPCLIYPPGDSGGDSGGDNGVPYYGICPVTSIITASAICAYGMLDPSRDICYAYKDGTLSNLYIDGVDVFSSLPSMPGPTGLIYYYTFANVASNHTINANFSTNSNTPCSNYPARLNRATPTNHLSLQAAYDSATDGDTIQGNMNNHVGGLHSDRNVSIYLDSGYSCDYSTKNGAITISGGMNIVKGTVSIAGSVVLK